jgi:hypothetical protein
MGFPTKVQLIKRKDSEQWYIFPAAHGPRHAVSTRRNRRVDHPRPRPAGFAPPHPAQLGAKKNETGAAPPTDWHNLFETARPAFAQQRTFERARVLGLSALACLGRRTAPFLLCAALPAFREFIPRRRARIRRWSAPAGRLPLRLPDGHGADGATGRRIEGVTFYLAASAEATPPPVPRIPF